MTFYGGKRSLFRRGICKEKSWYEVIQDMVKSKISDQQFESFKDSHLFNTPLLKESMFYRMIFEKHFEINTQMLSLILDASYISVYLEF